MITNQPNALDRTVFLLGWLNEPYMQDMVVAALGAAQRPLTLREVAQAADVPLRSANRILYRLWKKQLVSRYKLPMQRHAFCRRRWQCIPNAARRMLYVYTCSGDRVIVRVTHASVPNWVGTDMVRMIRLAGDRLSISTPPFVVGGTSSAWELVWKRPG